ncbi:hypothetical protein U6B65_07860 [Oscillospiraceae bacterium MB08-C2-2]|nr:hypothetical protein U6B65_07860 [Oscillospiraceae bacterium MB08-C2-2]
MDKINAIGEKQPLEGFVFVPAVWFYFTLKRIFTARREAVE